MRSIHRRMESDPKGKSVYRNRDKHSFGRNDRIRTCDIVLPKHARYQLRYIPIFSKFKNYILITARPNGLNN